MAIAQKSCPTFVVLLNATRKSVSVARLDYASPNQESTISLTTIVGTGAMNRSGGHLPRNPAENATKTTPSVKLTSP